MKLERSNEQVKGAAFTAGAYILWGILPIYWKLLEDVPAAEVLAHRIVWSFVFLLALLTVTCKLQVFTREVLKLIRQPRKLLGIFIAAVILNINWGTYIWAVNHDHIIQTSLGYYINPLVSVMLGIIVLKERLSFWELVAFLLAVVGVLNLTIHYSAFPWVALTLAITFGIYGLFKKVIDIGAITGLTLETLLTCVLAFSYLIYVHNIGNGAFHFSMSATTLFLIGAGIVTAIPLLLFAGGTRRLPLYIIGFLQYISPTMTLLLGIFVYHEPFTRAHLLSFMIIWAGLILFSLGRTRLLVSLEERIMKMIGVALKKIPVINEEK